MKRIIYIITIVSLILTAALSITSCGLPSSGATNSSQPVSTVTVTATSTTTSTATVTVTPSVKATTPSTVPESSTPPKTSTSPVVSQIDSNNNAHFYIRKDLTGYDRKLQPDGTYSQTPIYQDIFVDWKLGGFIAPKDAIFVPRIPTMTDHDDWFFRFYNSQFKVPWIVNWGFILKPNSQNTNISFYLFRQEFFEASYYKSPDNLLSGSTGMDRGVSSGGTGALAESDYGGFAGLIRTNNPDNVLGWWVKFGGE